MAPSAQPDFARARESLEVRKILRDNVSVRGSDLARLAHDFISVLSGYPNINDSLLRVTSIAIDEAAAHDRSRIVDALVAIHNDLSATSDELVALRAAQLTWLGCWGVKVRCVGKVVGCTKQLVHYHDERRPRLLVHPIVSILPELVVPRVLGGRVLRAGALHRGFG